MVLGCLLAAGAAYVLRSTPASPSSTGSPARGAEPGAARFIVTERVVARDVERIGAVLGTLTRWGTNLTTNNLMPGAGYEPAYDRYLRRIDRAGDGWFEWDSYGGVSESQQNGSGWGNGARIRFYRLVDESGGPLSYRDSTDMSAIDGADRVVFVGEATVSLPDTTLPKGGWDSANNRVWIDRKDLDLRFGDYAFITVKTRVLTKDMSHNRLAEQFEPNPGFVRVPDGWSTVLENHDYGALPEDLIGEDPGETFLKITAGPGRGAVVRNLFHEYDSGEGQRYSQLHPGARYRAEAWLKQEGIEGGEVRFDLGGAYATANPEAPWVVGEQWAKYGYEFEGPPYPAGDEAHQHMGLVFSGPGILHVDNFLVYRIDDAGGSAPFAPSSLALDEFVAFAGESGRKPSIRFNVYATHSPMERHCSDFASSKTDFVHNISDSLMFTIRHALEFAYRTGDSPETRAVPWFTLSEEYTEAEWKKLVEYLGRPYDPDADTQASRPMAHLRHTQRGHGRPWTDEFREILIEYGNETWHGGAGGFGWDGFGRPGDVWRGGVEYGLFARYMFDEQVGSMSDWEAEDLSSRISFVLNGGYKVGPDEYGEVSVKKTTGRSVRAVSHSNYVGPKWETEDEHMLRFDSDGLQRSLVAGSQPSMTQNYLAQHARLRDRAAKEGTRYDLVVYEGGPSGYSIPGTSSRSQAAVSELYGKSVAMATAVLDAFLYSSLVGYSYQNFNQFVAGPRWSSHTMPEMGGFVPHASWLVAKMRNKYVVGDDMVDVIAEAVPIYRDQHGREIPMVGAYAFRGDAAYSVILTSRALGDGPKGTWDGSVPVSLSLPFQSAKRITLHRLAHDDGSLPHPAENNLNPVVLETLLADIPEEQLEGGLIVALKDPRRIAIQVQEIDASHFSSEFTVDENTGGVPGGLPPGAAYLYVFELDSSHEPPTTEPTRQGHGGAGDE